MNAPSILPWIAHRHRVPMDRAQELWDEAVTMADLRFGRGRTSSEYWDYLLNTLLRLTRCDGASLLEDCAGGEAGDEVSPGLEMIRLQSAITHSALARLDRMLHLGAKAWASSVARESA